MNPRLFGAIVIVGSGVAGIAGCRSEILPPPDLAVASARDMAVPDLAAVDEAVPVDQATDFANSDLQTCCTFPGGPPEDLSGCIPVQCILL